MSFDIEVGILVVLLIFDFVEGMDVVLELFDLVSGSVEVGVVRLFV